MAMAVALFILILAAPTVYGADHVVGDNSGWSLGVVYSTWASGKTFAVGDNLVFNYDSSHSVDEVNKAAYDSCSSSNPINHYSGGSNKIALTSAGTKYFLCPTVGHCQGGMKLTVVVAASGGSPPTTPSPSSGSTPTPTTPASPSPTGSTNSPPPPGDSGAAGSLGSISAVVLGSGAVLATILGFM